MIKFKMRLYLYIFCGNTNYEKGININDNCLYLLRAYYEAGSILSAIFSLNNLEMSYCIIPVSQMRKLRHYQSSNSSSDQSCLLQKTVGQPAYTDLNCIFKMPVMSSSMWMVKSSNILVFAAEK